MNGKKYQVGRIPKGGIQMIDFQNASFLKLRQVSNSEYQEMTAPLLVLDEQIVAAYKGIRDGVVFTNMRLIVINVQGLTGKKKDFSSLPYSKIQAFSVETAGVLDLDSELELWFSGLGKVKLEFTGQTDIKTIGNLIGHYVFR